MIGRGSSGVFEAHRFLPPPIPHLLLRLKVSVPGIVGVTIKVIVVHGELRERIPDVSGRWGMGIDVPRSSRGQAPIFWISRAQLFRYSFELLQFQLGDKEREAVEWGWNQEAGNSMFHLVNAYTRAAQFEGLSAEASYRLQKVGGMVK